MAAMDAGGLMECLIHRAIQPERVEKQEEKGDYAIKPCRKFDAIYFNTKFFGDKFF